MISTFINDCQTKIMEQGKYTLICLQGILLSTFTNNAVQQVKPMQAGITGEPCP